MRTTKPNCEERHIVNKDRRQTLIEGHAVSEKDRERDTLPAQHKV